MSPTSERQRRRDLLAEIAARGDAQEWLRMLQHEATRANNAEAEAERARRVAYEVGCPNWPHPGIVGCEYCIRIEEALGS